MAYSILEANFFMEVWLCTALGFDIPNAKARVFREGEGKLSWVSYNDVAQLDVAALHNPNAKDRVLPVGGPEPLSPKEVIRVFEEALGKSFAVDYVPEEALQQQFADAPDPLNQSFAALMLAYAMGNPMDMEPVLKDFQLPLTSIREFAEQSVERMKQLVSEKG